MEYVLAINTVRRIEVDIAEQVTATASANRVPLPKVFEATSSLNGVLDNFHSIKCSLAGTGSSNDIMLVIFQNVPFKLMKPPKQSEISERSLTTQSRTTVKLRSKVRCQELIWM